MGRWKGVDHGVGRVVVEGVVARRVGSEKRSG